MIQIKTFLPEKEIAIVAGVALALILVVGVSYTSIKQTNSKTSTQQKTTQSVKAKKNQLQKSDSLSSQSGEESASSGPEVPSAAPSTSGTSAPGSGPTAPSSSTKQKVQQSSTSKTAASVAQVPSCNQVMKTSYTNLYNSKVAAERARWSNRVNAIRSEANARGMAFGGLPQHMIDQEKPTHDANIAAINNEYNRNLYSINCL